jgi:hypothetical protein
MPARVRSPRPFTGAAAGLFACVLTVVSVLWPTAFAAPVASALRTAAEQSGFVRTGRYDEVERLCVAFAAAYPDAVRCRNFGTTPEGRPQLVLVATRSGVFDPATAQVRKLPVVLVQGGIHAGEIEGKDAGFLALRQMLDGQAAPGAGQAGVAVRAGVQRGRARALRGLEPPNQRGPEEMGRRSTAQNYNLNRDYMKLDAPEMRAMQALLRQWDPVLMADLHTTDGAQFQPDVAVQIEPLHAGDAELATQGQALSDRLLGALRKQGAMPLPWYPTFLRRDEPASGFAANVYQPRFSTGYFQQRNRFAVLVETHSWKDYATRVRITRDFIVDLMAEAGRHGSAWLSAHAADARSARLAGQPCRWTGRPPTRRGRSTSPATPTCAARPPFPVPSSSATTSASRSLESAAARTCRAIGAGHSAEGGLSGAGCAGRTGAATARSARHRVSPHRPSAVEAAGAGMADGQGHVCFRSVRGPADAQGGGCVEPEQADLVAGALFVPSEQPLARLVMGLLEPTAPDSLLTWGQFNGMFEAKEYMESYVAEDVAREQLRDPAVAAEFAEKLKDPAFAADPRARLAFFIKRHPSWERELDLYPVYRLERRRMPLPCSDRADGAARASGR